MSKAMLNIYVRTFRRRMDTGETFQEILASYPRLTDDQAQEIKDALEAQVMMTLPDETENTTNAQQGVIKHEF